MIGGGDGVRTITIYKPKGDPVTYLDPTKVNVDNDSSRTFTVVEVFTEDKPGVLYVITHTLAERGLDIHRSRVGVAADHVADIFYVRDTASGEKIEDEKRIEAISAALKLALKT